METELHYSRVSYIFGASHLWNGRKHCELMDSTEHTHSHSHSTVRPYENRSECALFLYLMCCCWYCWYCCYFCFFGFSSPNWYDDLFSQFGNSNSVFRLQCTESDGHAWVSRFCTIAVLNFLLVINHIINILWSSITWTFFTEWYCLWLF